MIIDNCPLIYNPNQNDTDNDGIGDFCNNCPVVSNPDQKDLIPEDGPEGAGNGVGDVCEGETFDTDQDLIKDIIDNCPEAFNPKQLDSDNDGIGDECDNCKNDPDNQCQFVTTPLIADAGTNQSLDEKTVCYLDGSNSKSYATDIKIYSWEQLSGTVVNLQNPDSPKPFFTAPDVGIDDEILTFRITVYDNYGNVGSDTCDIKVINHGPGDENSTCFISSVVGDILIFSNNCFLKLY